MIAASPGVGEAVLKLELSVRGLLLLGLAGVLLWTLMSIWPVVLLVIVAFIFMAALLPYVELFVRWRMPRALAVLLVLLIVIIIVGGLFALVVPAMIDEFDKLRDNLPNDAQDLENFLDNFGLKVELSDRVQDIDWTSLISGQVAIDYGQRVVFGILSAITVIVITAYLLIDAPRMKAYLYRFIPDAREVEADRILQALGRVVGGYIRGQIITSAIIGVFTTVVLASVGVDNALAFGVLAAFADIIPLIGAFIAIVPATVGAFSESPTQAIIVVAALLVYQQFEDRFLVPRVYGATLGLPPVVVLLAVLVGAELLGIPGILLALPATAAGKVFLDYFLDQRDPKNAFADRTAHVQVAAPDDEPEPTSSGEGRAGGSKQGKLFRRKRKPGGG
jgi:putative heme transporter